MNGSRPVFGFLAEPDFRHAFPIEAMLRVVQGPVVTTGRRLAARLAGVATVHRVQPQEIGSTLAALGVDVVFSTSQILHPDALRAQAPGLRVVHLGHGESDKTRSYGPVPRPMFVLAPVNRRFDLMIIASHEHYRLAPNPRKALVGYLKHDLFVAGGYAQRPVEPDHVLWSPSWGRHNSVRRWLSDVVRVTAELGLRCVIHLHPGSYDFEPDLVQRVQVEVLRHRHVRLAHMLNVLDLMARCPVMLGDVSSVCYDWLMFDRPIVFLDHEALRFEEEKALFPVGRAVSSPSGLREALEEARAAPAALGPARRKALAERFYGLDGHAAERALEITLRYWDERWRPDAAG